MPLARFFLEKTGVDGEMTPTMEPALSFFGLIVSMWVLVGPFVINPIIALSLRPVIVDINIIFQCYLSITKSSSV